MLKLSFNFYEMIKIIGNVDISQKCQHFLEKCWLLMFFQLKTFVVDIFTTYNVIFEPLAAIHDPDPDPDRPSH